MLAHVAVAPPVNVPSYARPSVVDRLARARPVQLVWENEMGGRTFQLGVGPEREFAKWMPPRHATSLEAERVRLAWAERHVTVPRVVDHAIDAEGAWLVTRGLPGDNAIADRWKREPAAAVRAIGAGLRAFHDALPVEACPFDWSAGSRLAAVRARAAEGRLRRDLWNADHAHLDVDAALASLDSPPPVDVLVVCHGDTSAPNTLLDDYGRCCGHVDLGMMGVADRWADLAIATWSTQWNYGRGWDGALLEAYGVAPDEQRTRYYRLLWDLGP
jgi:kanamycin kinase